MFWPFYTRVGRLRERREAVEGTPEGLGCIRKGEGWKTLIGAFPAEARCLKVLVKFLF